MTDNQDLVKCPLCEGHGHVDRAVLTQRLNDGTLNSERDDSKLGGVCKAEAALDTSTVGGAARDFQKEVHSWNPRLPMWRRSPKE